MPRQEIETRPAFLAGNPGAAGGDNTLSVLMDRGWRGHARRHGLQHPEAEPKQALLSGFLVVLVPTLFLTGLFGVLRVLVDLVGL